MSLFKTSFKASSTSEWDHLPLSLVFHHRITKTLQLGRSHCSSPFMTRGHPILKATGYLYVSTLLDNTAMRPWTCPSCLVSHDISKEASRSLFSHAKILCPTGQLFNIIISPNSPHSAKAIQKSEHCEAGRTDSKTVWAVPLECILLGFNIPFSTRQRDTVLVTFLNTRRD